MQKYFYKDKIRPLNTEKVVISERFRNDDGSFAEFEIKAVTEEERLDIYKICNYSSKGYNPTDYSRAFTAAGVVFPNLKNAELQNSWGVAGAEELLAKMLLPGEFNKLETAILRINGYFS